MTETETETFTIDQIRVDSETHQKNQERHNGNHADECFACGRGLTESALEKGYSVEMLTSGEIIAADDPRSLGDDSQGTFPLGSECSKKVPKALRRKTMEA